MCHCLRKQQSRLLCACSGVPAGQAATLDTFWIPAFAGMTHGPLHSAKMLPSLVFFGKQQNRLGWAGEFRLPRTAPDQSNGLDRRGINLHINIPNT